MSAEERYREQLIELVMRNLHEVDEIARGVHKNVHFGLSDQDYMQLRLLFTSMLSVLQQSKIVSRVAIEARRDESFQRFLDTTMRPAPSGQADMQRRS